DCTACVWDTVSGEQVCSFQQHTGPLASLVYSPDSTIITGSHDGTARIWDALSGEQRCILEHTGPVISVTCSPDSNTILTGSYIPGSGEFIVRLWDGVTGEQRRELSIVTELEKSLNWKEKMPLAIMKKAIELLAQHGVVSHTSSLELSVDGTAAFTSWAIGPHEHSPLLHLVQLWSNGYSKDFMNWVTTEIKPLQSWLLLRIIQADKAGEPFTMMEESLEHTLLKSIPADFQSYLIKRYSITISPAEKSEKCSIQ
ncbi:hypothetical protein H0W26_04925, partial [Candidatus Dependentiae bacterium]|nr:hypothetical protein [Candidatus Dependentiae bacterium]